MLIVSQNKTKKLLFQSNPPDKLQLQCNSNTTAMFLNVIKMVFGIKTQEEEEKKVITRACLTGLKAKKYICTIRKKFGSALWKDLQK